MATSGEISRIIDESSRRLLQVGSPPVKYWLLKEVMGKGSEDEVVARTSRECCSYRPRVRLLNAIDENGFWRMKKRHYERLQPGDYLQGWQLTVMIKNLFKLLQCCTETDEERVGLVLENILSWQTEEGYIPGTWTKAFPIPYVNGQILYEFNRFGLTGDSRVRKLRSWLLSVQRRDGGWNIPYRQDVYYFPEFKKMGVLKFLDLMEAGEIPEHDLRSPELQRIPSCSWSTVFVLMGLAESDEYMLSHSAARGCALILERLMKKNPHRGFWESASHWRKLKYPLFESGGIAALHVLTKLCSRSSDLRMEEAIDWLVHARGPEGLWSAEVSNGRESEQWLTLWSLMILDRFRKGS